MKKLLTTLFLSIGMLVATSCAIEPTANPTDDDDSDNQDSNDDDDSDDSITIPDPGTDYAPLRWYDDGGYHGTPDTAQVMGIALDIPDYVQGGVDPETGNHYFVFRTDEYLTEFSVSLHNASSQIEFVHIHEGTGLVFGDEVPPTAVYSPRAAAWDLEPDTIYVLEVHSPGGGFF